MDREAWRDAVHEATKSQTQLSTRTRTHIHTHTHRWNIPPTKRKKKSYLIQSFIGIPGFMSLL